MNRLVAQVASLLYRRLQSAVRGIKLKLRAPCERPAGWQPVVFGTQNACGFLALSPREERAGRESERGEIVKKGLLSPALSSFLRRRGRENAVARSKQIFPYPGHLSAINPMHFKKKWGLLMKFPLASLNPLILKEIKAGSPAITQCKRFMGAMR